MRIFHNLLVFKKERWESTAITKEEGACWRKLSKEKRCNLHDHPFYLVCPDVLSLVEELSGNGYGSSEHTRRVRKGEIHHV